MKKYTFVIISILISASLLGFYIFYHFNRESKPLKYLECIEKVYNSDISGIGVFYCKTSDLHGNDDVLCLSAFGNKANNFSSDSVEGVRLWSAKQLFQRLKSLKAINKGLPEMLESGGKEFYLIQTNQDYTNSKSTNIYYLALFVNPANYHVYLPENYYEPNQLLHTSTNYIEFKPDEIVKQLVNDIISDNIES